MQAQEVFCHPLTVKTEDVDVLGHASNIAYIRWIQEVAIAHSAAVGFDLDAYMRLGAAFVVARHEVDYLRPAMLGDRVEARTWISTAMIAKFLRMTELVRVSDGELLAKALTTWGFVEIATGRPRRIREEVRLAFAPFVHAATT